MHSRLATERNCLKSPVSLVTKYCPTSTTRTNPASSQNYSLSFLVKTIQFVLCTVTIEFDDSKGFRSAQLTVPPISQVAPVPSWWFSYSSHIAATAP